MLQVSCAFCKGKGKDPFDVMSSLSNCCVCNGKGLVQVQVPYEACAHCRGTGAIKTFTCNVCNGKGVVSALPEPTVICPECRGTGDDSSAMAMACLKCHGRGRITGNNESERGK
ncbi:MAG: hypothetical protein HZA78_11405 [Candidatus Schekmanbacteria bacterium]|nr:hypothetical protein [Candidatus Schekmanbacteria bacterium]